MTLASWVKGSQIKKNIKETQWGFDVLLTWTKANYTPFFNRVAVLET